MNVTGRLIAHCSVVLTPILYAQGMYTRARIAKLPEAGGPRQGRVDGGSSVLRLLLLGESTVAGVGANNHNEGLAGQTAEALNAMTGATVEWHVHAANGLTAAALRTSISQLPSDIRADVIVIAIGANDVFRLQGPMKWKKDFRALVDTVRDRCGFAPVMLSAMPPIGYFPGLPQPLRSVLGLRARLLDHASAGVAAKMASVHFVPIKMDFDPSLFSADGIHPSTSSYAIWGRLLAEAALDHLPRRG